METPGGRFTSIFMDFDSFNFYYGFWLIDNANRTEWSPIRSVIIQVIDEIAGVQFLNTSIIKDRNGRHDTSPESPVTN